MIGNFRTWWQGRSLREQRLLLVMGGLAAIVLVWLLVVRPLSNTLSEVKTRHDQTVLAFADIRATAEAIKDAQQGGSGGFTGAVDALVSQSAVEAGFTVARLDREGPNQATLVLDAVRPQAFFGWLAQMERRGLIVDRMAATPNGDRTLSVQVTFRGRG